MRLRDRRRLERRVGEQVTAERAAALRHVGRHAADRQPDDLRDLLLGPDGSLQARPDLGAVRPHVGDRAVGLERVAGAEVEGEAAGRSTARAPASSAARRCAGPPARRRRTCRPPAPAPTRTSSARTASMHCPNVCARTATPPGTNFVCGMIATSVTPGIAFTCAALLTLSAVPLIVGGRHTIVGSAPGTSRSIANCLRPGHRVERIDPPLRGPDDAQLRLGLQLRKNRSCLRHGGAVPASSAYVTACRPGPRPSRSGA